MKFYRIGENNKKNAMAKYIYSFKREIFLNFTYSIKIQKARLLTEYVEQNLLKCIVLFISLAE